MAEAGGSVIGALRVFLGLDSAAFQEGLKNASKVLKNFGTSIDQAIKVAGQFGKSIQGAFGAVGNVMAQVTRAFATFGPALERADLFGKTAARIGLTTEALSRLEYAASHSMVSLAQLQTGFTQLSRNMANLADPGGNTPAAAFKALGIEVKNANGTFRSSQAVFGDVAEAFSRMRDGADKTRMATQIFGEAGVNLIPMLNLGRAGLAGMAEEADALGITLTTQTSEAAARFTSILNKGNRAWEGMMNRLTSAVLPGLEKLAATFNDPALQKSLGDLMFGLGAGLSEAFKLAEVAFRSFVGFGNALSAKLGEITTVSVGVATALVGVGAAFAVAFAPAVIASVGAMAAMLKTQLLTAIGAISAVLMANPIVAIGVGIAAVTAGLIAFREQIKTLTGLDIAGFFEGIGAAVFGFASDVAIANKEMTELTLTELRRRSMLLQNEATEIENQLYRLNQLRERGARFFAGEAIGPMVEGLAARVQPLINQMAEVNRLIAEQERLAVAAGANISDWFDGLGETFVGNRAEFFAFLRGDGGNGGGAAAIADLGVVLDRVAPKVEEFVDKWKDFSDTLQGSVKEALTSIIGDFRNGELSINSVTDAVGRLTDKLVDFAVEAALTGILSTLFRNPATIPITGFGGGGNPTGIGIGTPMAEGGPVTAGRAYVVGEKRPELFVPRMSGTIIPEVAGVGGAAAPRVVINNYGPPLDQRQGPSMRDIELMVRGGARQEMGSQSGGNSLNQRYGLRPRLKAR